MLARIRKAVVAGALAALAAGGSTLVQAAAESTVDRAAVSHAIGLAVAAAATVGWATWKTRNRPA